MALFTLNPTANQTPDPGQGGAAVTGISNTAHSATTASCSCVASAPFGINSASAFKSANWLSFSAVSGQILGVRLKFDWSVSGSTNVTIGAGGSASASASSTIESSVNGGGAWVSQVSQSASSTGSYNVSNSADINLGVVDPTQVKIRDSMSTSVSAGAGLSQDSSADASASITVSNIRLEVTTLDATSVIFLS